MKRFVYVDALRGYAVLGVVLVHTSQYAGFGFEAAFGARGVQLFFVASALTLMFSWNSRHDGTTAFFVRRLFRIAPMFWLSIPIYLGLSADAYTPQVLGAALFSQAARPDWIVASIVPGGWSVCAEMAFYCTFPWIAQNVTSFLKACALAVVCFTVAAFWDLHWPSLGLRLFPTFTHDEIEIWAFLSVPTQLPAFAIGVLCYFVIPEWKNFVGRVATEVVLAAVLIWIVYLATIPSALIAEFSLAFGTVAICLANGAGRYLINPAVVYVGRFSFSIYLLHWRCVAYVIRLADAVHVSGGWRFAVLFCGTAALTTAVAAVMFYAVERPMVRLGNWLIARAKTGDTPEVFGTPTVRQPL